MIKFSVVIPAYNASETIVSTIESCLGQSFIPFEIIVIDDCSTDETVALVQAKFSGSIVKIISFSVNQGVAKARNHGWELAAGDYIAFLDADDIWHKEKLMIISEILDFEGVVCLGHLYTHNYKLLNIIPSFILKRELTFYNLLIRNYFNTSSLVVKRDIVFRFNESMRYTEDHELLIRISAIHKILLLNVYLTLLGRPQLSKGGLSGNKLKMRLGEMKMYFSAARSKSIVYVFLPVLIVYSCFKHLIKIFK